MFSLTFIYHTEKFKLKFQERSHVFHAVVLMICAISMVKLNAVHVEKVSVVSRVQMCAVLVKVETAHQLMVKHAYVVRSALVEQSWLLLETGDVGHMGVSMVSALLMVNLNVVHVSKETA